MTDTSRKPDKPEWVPPMIKESGTVASILKGGGGKLSIETTDTGDTRKPKGQG